MPAAAGPGREGTRSPAPARPAPPAPRRRNSESGPSWRPPPRPRPRPRSRSPVPGPRPGPAYLARRPPRPGQRRGSRAAAALRPPRRRSLSAPLAPPAARRTLRPGRTPRARPTPAAEPRARRPALLRPPLPPRRPRPSRQRPPRALPPPPPPLRPVTPPGPPRPARPPPGTHLGAHGGRARAALGPARGSRLAARPGAQPGPGDPARSRAGRRGEGRGGPAPTLRAGGANRRTGEASKAATSVLKDRRVVFPSSFCLIFLSGRPGARPPPPSRKPSPGTLGEAGLRSIRKVTYRKMSLPLCNCFWAFLFICLVSIYFPNQTLFDSLLSSEALLKSRVGKPKCVPEFPRVRLEPAHRAESWKEL